MKYIFLIFYALILGIAFYLACRFELQLSGDSVWVIYYSILLFSTVAASILTHFSSAVFAIGILAPFVGMGMFVIVNVFFSAVVTCIGVLLAMGVHSVWDRPSRIQQTTEQNAAGQPAKRPLSK